MASDSGNVSRTMVIEIKHFSANNRVIHTANCKLILNLNCSPRELQNSGIEDSTAKKGLADHALHSEPGNPKKALFVLRTNEQIEMFRESKSRSLFKRVIQRVPSFQNGTINILFESSSFSNSDSVVATPTCTSNTANDFGKTPKKPTKTTRTKSGNELPQTHERLKEFLDKKTM